MKKTKKQKIIADLRKKMVQLENSNNEKTFKIQEKSVITTPLSDHSSQNIKIDHNQISRDLRKTLILSTFILVSLFLLKYLLKA